MDNTFPAYGDSGVLQPFYDQVEVVQTAADMPLQPSPTILYVIDGIVNMGSQSIEVPAGGFHCKGHNLGLSGLVSSADAFTLFTSPVSGSGDIFMSDMYVQVTGAGSQVYDVVATGFPAIEVLNFNYMSCSSLGEINGYRQLLESNTGRFGGKPTTTLSGTWSGGARTNTSIILNLDSDMTGSIFEEGTDFVMSGRFRTDINCDLPANASFADFRVSNFSDSSLLQVNGAKFSRNGVISSGDNNFFPNLDPSDLVCEWIGNNGLRNTHVGGRMTLDTEIATTVLVPSTYVDVLGTWAASDLQHFSMPVNGQLRNDGKSPQEFTLVGSFVLESGANNLLAIKALKWSEVDQVFTDISTSIGQVLSTAGSRDVALINMYYSVTLEQNDFIKLQLTNQTGLTAVTIEAGSFVQIKTR